ncbi:MAG: transposase [Ktedonobacteraceae bacterium]
MVYRKYNPDRFTRQSLRISDRDYSSASAYYVTIRAEQHEPVFEIPELRKILEETWQALPHRFPGVTLDEFVIMPDHIHFIIWLDGTMDNAPTLGSVVGAYKSITTVTWYEHLKTKGTTWPGYVWQRNYYERVLRISELKQKRLYIRNNPTKHSRKM